MATWSKLVQVCRVAKIVLGSLRSKQDGAKKKMNRTNQSCEESASFFDWIARRHQQAGFASKTYYVVHKLSSSSPLFVSK